MQCECCEDFFEIKIQRGGQNRSLCYKCLPEGLSKKERNTLRTTLLLNKAREEKLKMGCSSCGYCKNAAALEWHHPEEDKERHPSDALKRSWYSYQLEVSNCVLLCANCHREVHNPD